MHVDPWHFNQIRGTGERLPQMGKTHPVYLQYERDYIATALAQAIATATEYLGFPPAPDWIEEEVVTINSDLPWDGQTLATRYGHVREFGRRAATLIQANVSVTYSDADDDQVDETATITVTSSHPASEIEVFFRVADGAAGAASEYWRIEPLTVSKDGSTVTITGHRSLFVKPRVWAGEYNTTVPIEKDAGSTLDADAFVQQVDVYRVYADATSAVELLLDPASVGAANAVVNATASISNRVMGHFRLYSEAGQTAPMAQPHTVRVSYRAGLPLVNGQMARALEAALVKYANVLMPQQPTLDDGYPLLMWAESRKERDVLAAEAWNPPPFGLTNAGRDLAAVIAAQQLHLKGKPLKDKR